MPKTATIAVLIAVSAAISAPQARGVSPSRPLPQGVASFYSGAGHAPNEPAASVRGHRSSFQYLLKSRKLASTAKACNQIPWYQKYEFKDPYGVVLVGYYEQIYYCKANGLVTYFYRYRWAKVSSIVPFVHWTPWDFDGNQPSGNDCAGEHCFIRGYKAPSRTAITLGKFHTCLIPIINAGCNYLWPRITITVYGDGSKPDSGWSD